MLSQLKFDTIAPLDATWFYCIIKTDTTVLGFVKKEKKRRF